MGTNQGPYLDSDFTTLPSVFFTTDYEKIDYGPRWLLPRWEDVFQSPNVRCFPPEIFSEIFLYTTHIDPRSRKVLMLVCRRWHNIMLSTPGIRSQLRIHNKTKLMDVRGVARMWLLDVIIDRNRPGVHFDSCFDACLWVAAQVASRWRSLALLSFPPSSAYNKLKTIRPLQHLESLKVAASYDTSSNVGNFLEPLVTAINTTVTPRFTVMEVFNPDAALYLVQSSQFQIFSFLTTLRLICRRMQDPVDILPSLHKLEIFEAHHLSLPIYSPAVNLSLTQSLRALYLKSASVQWMAGRIFPALKECSIIFPHHTGALQSVCMPSCSSLKYDSNSLHALEHFHHPPLARLEVKSGQWNAWRGNVQLSVLHRIFAAQSMTCLHLDIKCSEKLLVCMLELVPALEELWMGLYSPHALSSAFFLTFAARGRNASEGPSSQTTAPLCRLLKMLHLHYKRWSRGAERNALISAFGAIVASHPKNFSFQLRFDEGPKSQEWIIHKPVERFDVELENRRTFIGVSSPYGIVPLSSLQIISGGGHHAPSLLTEAEYITTIDRLTLPIDYLFSHHCLKEVRISCSILKGELNTPLSPNAPLFHTLKVLAVLSAPPTFLTGQTFHKLERYQEECNSFEDNRGLDPLTELPVCTRLVVPLSRLATLKLPQIRELAAFIDHKEPDYLWEKRIAVNVNLSGVKLLALSTGKYNGSCFSDITEILGSLPSLETLVLTRKLIIAPYVTFFEAFIPMNAQGTSGLSRSGWEGQISGVLCPRLESLQIEGIRLDRRPEMMPVLKDIVTLRAITGSPLKSFTFYHWPPKKWQLIGRDRSFIMERVAPAQKFQLDI